MCEKGELNRSKALSVIMLSLLLIGMLALAFDIQPVKAEPKTIYVDDDNTAGPWDGTPEHPYKNITSGIEHASAGDTIYVYNGTYYENVVANKAIEIIGENKQTTIIDCYQTGIVVRVTASNVRISGFTIQNSSRTTTTPGDYGVVLDSSTGCNISGNIVTKNFGGVKLSNSHTNTISQNDIRDNQNVGIKLLGGDFNVINGNNISNHFTAISTYYTQPAHNNTITRNIIAHNMEGIFLHFCDDNMIQGNIITNNTCFGIKMYGTVDNVVSQNIIANTKDDGIIVLDSSGNIIYHNNFINNSRQAIIAGVYKGSNTWDDSYPSGGNYWSNYNGTDANGDGIGDTPYVIGASNTDRYPLVNPWTPIETKVRVKGKDYPVVIVSNTTIDQIVATINTLHFKSSGMTGDKGYINVVFPMVNTTAIKVFIDGAKLTPPPFPVINTNGTHYFIHFEFTLSIHNIAIQFAPLEYTLTVDSSPTGVTFTVDGVSHTTPWSGTYAEGTSVSLEMPKYVYTAVDTRYSWQIWSDGNTSRMRTVTMTANLTLTSLYLGPMYAMTTTSLPITGIPYTIDGTPSTTPDSGWIHEGSYTIEMPETYDGYVWSHWLEDGDTNRIKALIPPGTYTAVYEIPPPPPVGGTTISIKSGYLSLWIASILLIISLVVTSGLCLKRKRSAKE